LDTHETTHSEPTGERGVDDDLLLGLPVEDEELIPANLEHGSLHSHIYHLRTAYVDFTENVTEGQPLPASPERYV